MIIIIIPTAYGPPPPGLFIDIQQTNKPSRPADQQTNQKSTKIAPQINEKSPKICFQRPSWRGCWCHVGLKNRSWRAMLGSKIGLGGPLGESWSDLGPKSQSRPPKGEEMGLQGFPWDPQLGGQVGPKTDQVGTKWRPSWRLCRHVPSSLCPCGSKDPSEPHPRPT